ncbi:hypothetical protein SAMN05216464_13030 [Mucilaginibacter pineti]|uniref:Uncharacterized protein n=1 Tax=Mucilaginibacter pineti TaxID=1391627 RepID=A0A1G7NWG9_9SPHI|nr:hypothetical protein SAMN05216464_13030 [Mucilaginibacter pineti]
MAYDYTIELIETALTYPGCIAAAHERMEE